MTYAFGIVKGSKCGTHRGGRWFGGTKRFPFAVRGRVDGWRGDMSQASSARTQRGASSTSCADDRLLCVWSFGETIGSARSRRCGVGGSDIPVA